MFLRLKSLLKKLNLKFASKKLYQRSKLTKMTDFTSYNQLRVTEDASFEEIKSARDRLILELGDDIAAQELVEAAYDAILMDRLRARQEGRIKVPDGIRYPEKNAVPAQSIKNQNQSRWFSSFIDIPEPQDLLQYSGVFAVLAVLVFLAPPLSSNWLSLAFLASVFFLRRKENKFWRSALLALLALVFGFLAGSGLVSLLALSPANLIASIIALFVMFLVTTLLR